MDRLRIADVPLLVPIHKDASEAEVIAALSETIRQVQETLLPTQEDLPQISDVTFDVFYNCLSNHERFGGDWYKVQPVAKWLGGDFRKDDVLAISLGDVAGHGLQAAVVMSKVVQTLQAAILAEHEPPSAVLSKANQMLNVKADNPMVTALFGYLNVRAASFEYAAAGQMPPCGSRGKATPSICRPAASRCAASRSWSPRISLPKCRRAAQSSCSPMGSSNASITTSYGRSKNFG